MELASFILEVLVQIAVTTACLWLAMGLTRDKGPLPLLLAAAFIAALTDLIPLPFVGGWISYIVLMVLLSWWTTAELWPDVILIVVVARSLAIFASIGLRAVLP
jgi:hypothetical protein